MELVSRRIGSCLVERTKNLLAEEQDAFLAIATSRLVRIDFGNIKECGLTFHLHPRSANLSYVVSSCHW